MMTSLRAALKTYLRTTSGVLRVLLLAVATLMIVVAVSAHSAVARAGDGMMDLGRHLMVLGESGMGGDGRRILLNGQQVHFRVFATEHDIGSVLDFYEGWCRGGSGDFAAQQRRLEDASQSISALTTSGDSSWRDLTLREVNDDTGFVACIKHGVPNIDSEELGSRAFKFMRDGNLADLGKFHYAAASKVGAGTRVVAVWTEGDFFPSRMFPEEGDAPGFDASAISRPPSGRRLLSAGELGHAENIIVYSGSDQSIAALGTFYRRDFLSQGWRVLADEREAPDLRFFIVQRGNEMRVVSLSVEEGAATTSVAIVTSK